MTDGYFCSKTHNQVSCVTRTILPSNRVWTRAITMGRWNSYQWRRLGLQLCSRKFCSLCKLFFLLNIQLRVLLQWIFYNSKFTRSSNANGLAVSDDCRCFPLDDSLIFESRFESGNLSRVYRITGNFYELHLRPDLYTTKHIQWYYFSIRNMQVDTTYR